MAEAKASLALVAPPPLLGGAPLGCPPGAPFGGAPLGGVPLGGAPLGGALGAPLGADVFVTAA